MIDREVPDEILDTWRAMGCSNTDARRSLQYVDIEPPRSGGKTMIISCRERNELTADEIAGTFNRLGLDDAGRQRMAELRRLGETPIEPPQRVVTTDNTTEDAIDHE